MMGFGGMRLLLGVTGVLDLIIPVLCVVLRIIVLCREGGPRLGGSFPKKSCPELGTTKCFSFLASPKPSGYENTPGVHLPSAREGFCHVCVVAGAQKEKPPPFFLVKNYFE